MKLIMRLYKPNKGLITIDNNDINKFNLYSLRSQLGFVPQDTILFNGTIQSNISFTKPEASFDEIREAAKIMKTGKSDRPNNIPNEVWKMVVQDDVIAAQLAAFFSTCFHKAILPKQ